MPSVAQIIRRKGRKYRVNPRALLAVARGEGGLRWGAVGDQGTSFGPFQLHRGGALPAGKGAAWANSPAGIDYAVRQMAQAGAAGLGPRAAVETIIRQFERPADPDTSVRNALERLPGIAKGGAMGPPPRSSGKPRTRTITTGYITNKPEVMALRAQNKQQFMNQLIEQSQARARGEPIDIGSMIEAATAYREAQEMEIVRTPKKKVVGLRRQPGAAPGLAGGRVAAGGKLIGSPYSGTHTLGNWQSDNAVDIAMAEGTPIYAAFNGVVGPNFGSLGSSNPRMAGLRMTLQGANNSLYYAHLSRFAPGVKPGAKIKKGQLIGFSGSANGVAHLHLGSERLDPHRYFGGK